MSFTAVNGATWAPGDKLTTAQVNKFDADHVNSLDKSVAGDTLSGIVSVTGTGQLLVNGAGCITTTGANGGIVLGAGPFDWPTFGATRSRVIYQPPIPMPTWPADSVGSDWQPSAHGPGAVGHWIKGQGTTTSIHIPLTVLHHGARLLSATCFFQVAGSHVGGLPAQQPQFGIYRTEAAVGVAGISLLSTGTVQLAAANPAAYYNAGAVQGLTMTCDQNHTINRAGYTYFIVLTDESGANAAVDNKYTGFLLTYDTIVDMAFF